MDFRVKHFVFETGIGVPCEAELQMYCAAMAIHIIETEGASLRGWVKEVKASIHVVQPFTARDKGQAS